VPLAFERQAERGFNQSQEIAVASPRQRPAAAHRHPAAHAHTRRRWTWRSAAAEQRPRRLRRPRHWPDALAVVDDVMTTGATLDEVAAALKAAGAAAGHQPGGGAHA